MGRYWSNLKNFDEVNLLLKYLYINEEHSVKYHNSMNFTFTLRMDDDGELLRTVNGLESELKSPEMTHLELFAIIEQLKKAEPEIYPDMFKTRWEEIETMYNNLAGFNALLQINRGGL